MKICPKGGGKTPALNVFLGPLSGLEREEKEDYDEEANDKKEKKKSKKFKMAKDESEMDEDEVDLGLVDVPGCSKLPPGSFDFNKKYGKEKKNRNSTTIDRKSKTDASQKIQDVLDANDLDPSQETNQSGDSKKTSTPSEFMFHPKTRLAQTITPAALFLTLHHGNHSLLVIADEYKVQGFNFYSQLQLFLLRALLTRWRKMEALAVCALRTQGKR